jgi:hypothetical protein
MSRKISINIPREVLYDLYWNKQLSLYKISKLYNCSITPIKARFKEYNISIRKGKELFKLRGLRGKDHPNYNGGKPKCIKCGKILSDYVSTKCSICYHNDMKGKTRAANNLTSKKLKNLYLNKKLTTYEIAKLYNCSNVTICSRLRFYNIEIRDAKENFKYMRFAGKNSCRYIDGRTPLYENIRKLEMSVKWRKQVFERDNYTCQECGDSTGGNLEAHHINSFSNILETFLKEYDQFSPIEDKETLVRLAFKYEPFWDLDNGITLCKDCHIKTNNYGRKNQEINNE